MHPLNALVFIVSFVAVMATPDPIAYVPEILNLGSHVMLHIIADHLMRKLAGLEC